MRINPKRIQRQACIYDGCAPKSRATRCLLFSLFFFCPFLQNKSNCSAVNAKAMMNSEREQSNVALVERRAAASSGRQPASQPVECIVLHTQCCHYSSHSKPHAAIAALRCLVTPQNCHVQKLRMRAGETLKTIKEFHKSPRLRRGSNEHCIFIFFIFGFLLFFHFVCAAASLFNSFNQLRYCK